MQDMLNLSKLSDSNTGLIPKTISGSKIIIATTTPNEAQASNRDFSTGGTANQN